MRVVPFGEYESFEDCVAKNKDKEDPKAYCAVIKRQIEESNRTEEDIKAKLLEINKQIATKEPAFTQLPPEQRVEIDALYAERRGLEDALAEFAKTKALMTEGKVLGKLRLFCEAYKFDGKKVSGVAIHPKKLWHPEEGETHIFLKEELKKSAPSLAGKPFGIDHLRLLPKPNLVEKSWYDAQEDGVAFEGTVDDQVAKRMHEGAFKGLSIELNWFRPGVMMEKMEGGIAPRNFDFTSVHLMSRFPPADKETFVKLWEGIVLPVVPPPLDIQIDQLRQLFEERIRYLEGQINTLTRSDPWTQAQAPAIIIFKEAETKITGEIAQLKSAVDRLKALKEAYVTEKTTRENALADKEKNLTAKESEFDATLRKLAERLNTPGPKESEVLVDTRKKLVEAEARAAESDKQLKQGVNEYKQKYVALHKGITESIPPPHVWNCWTFGPKQLIAQQMRILGIGPNDRW